MILNDSQKQAVEHLNGPLLVSAGPGSGKTRVIVERIKFLVENNHAKKSTGKGVHHSTIGLYRSAASSKVHSGEHELKPYHRRSLPGHNIRRTS